MRNRSLHAALEAFTEQAGFQLESDTAGGAEIPFEVIESPGARTPLYCYRPLTDRFIRERLGVLGRLPTYLPAARAVEGLGGVEDYLRARGEVRVPADPSECADAVLRSFLGSVFAETSEFGFEPERFERAYAELESVVYEGRALSTVIVPVHGLALESPELALGDGLSLVRGDTLADAPAAAVWSGPTRGEEANVLAVVTLEGPSADAEDDSEDDGEGPASLATVRLRLRRLLTALRLFDSHAMSLGPVAWSRADAGPWQLAALGGSGRAHGPPCFVAVDQEDELRGFCNLILRRTPGSGELAWALARFEMGCERLAPFEALTDHLLGLRALLEPEGPNSGRVAQRLAAICALPDERPALAERVAHAISLERAVMAGIGPAGPGADGLVDELAGHLRALLRDVLCGHLDSDLVSVADRLLQDAVTDERPLVATPS
jgi:hypothetical protein